MPGFTCHRGNWKAYVSFFSAVKMPEALIDLFRRSNHNLLKIPLTNGSLDALECHMQKAGYQHAPRQTITRKKNLTKQVSANLSNIAQRQPEPAFAALPWRTGSHSTLTLYRPQRQLSNKIAAKNPVCGECYLSFRPSISETTLGFACPFVFFITSPIRNPIAFLPFFASLVSATACGFALITSSTTPSSSPASLF